MVKKNILTKLFFPLSISFLSFLPLIFEGFVAPQKAYATNWNRYNMVWKRGLSNLNQGNYEKALDFYNQAIDIYKRDPSAYYNRGISHMELGNHENALKDYKKALKLDPEMSDQYTYNNMGVVYQELGDFENAKDSYTKAIEIDDKDGLYFHNRGYINMKLENWEDALLDYQTALEKYPQKKKGRGYLDCQENKKLIHCQMDEYFYNNIGWINYNLKDFKAALRNYDKAIEINPSDGLFFTNKGNTLYDMGDKKNACVNYKKSSSLGYEDIDDYLKSWDGRWCRKMKI